MIRIIKQRGKWYGVEIDKVEDDAENIDIHVKENGPVIIADDLDDFYEMMIHFDNEDVEMI